MKLEIMRLCLNYEGLVMTEDFFGTNDELLQNSMLYVDDCTNAIQMVQFNINRNKEIYTINTKDKQTIKTNYDLFKKICTYAYNRGERTSIQYKYTKNELEDLITMLKL